MTIFLSSHASQINQYNVPKLVLHPRPYVYFMASGFLLVILFLVRTITPKAVFVALLRELETNSAGLDVRLSLAVYFVTNHFMVNTILL